MMGKEVRRCIIIFVTFLKINFLILFKDDIYSLALSSSLPTLPFEVLRQLLDSSPLSTDDGVLLRRMICEVGAIHLVLNCLSIFTHHNSNLIPGPELLKSTSLKTQTALSEETASDDKSHVYWAKGTGMKTFYFP